MINIDDRLIDELCENQVFVILKILRRMRVYRMTAWPSIATIAKDCKWGEEKVKKYRNELIQRGLLDIEYRKGKSPLYSFRCNVGLYYGAQDEKFELEETEDTPHNINPPLKSPPPKITPTHPPLKSPPEEINKQQVKINELNTLSIKNENQNQNFSPKSEDQKAPPAPAPPPVDPLINAIELSMRWAQENAATVKFWFDTYKIEGWTPEKLKQEIGVFFSHYQTEHQSDLHTCRKDPAKYFASGFLKWLSRYSKQGEAQPQQRSNYAPKKTAINTAPQINRTQIQDF
jgi:hypothetical protein